MSTKNLFDQKLEKLRRDILDMSSLVEEDLGKALAALRNNDKELVKEVKANDKLVNEMQLKIEDETSIVIATESPVAGDLRELVTIFKITGNIERIGDHAVHLAKTAGKFASDPPFRSTGRLEKMAETGQKMFRMAITAFLNKDAAAARIAADMDNLIDGEHKLLIEEVLDHIREKKSNIKKAIRLLNTSGYLERLGDHITNICESIIYMVEVKHVELNN